MAHKSSDKETKREYESIGTLVYRASRTSNDTLFFVPDSDHSLKNSGDSYAVFIGPPRRKRLKVKKALAVKLGDDADDGIITKKSIRLKVSKSKEIQDILHVARRAAERQITVTVAVRRKRKFFKLVGITIPPR